MKSEHIAHLLPEYLEGELETNKQVEVKHHLEHCEECRKELKQFLILEELFEKEEEIEPSKQLEERFLAMLEMEKEEIPVDKKPFPFKKIYQIAAALAALFFSYQMGRMVESDPSAAEIVSKNEPSEAEQRIAMLSLMTDESASKRIQGVNYFEGEKELDDDILNVLNNKMLYDENTNVRLAAVEALGKFSESAEVKTKLITALKTEKDPVIQIALIQKLVDIKEKEAIEPMKKLLQDEETQPFVKEQIEALLPSII